MKRRLALLGVITFAFVALDVGLRIHRERSAVGVPGAPSPGFHVLDVPVPIGSFSARDLDGREVTPAQWRGRFALVNVWATWCVPCRVEIPDLVTLQTQHRDALQIVGVLQDAPDAQAERLIAALNINYPVVVTTAEIDSALGEALVLPTSYLVDPEGRIVATQAGRIDPAVIAAFVADRTRRVAGAS